LAQIDNLPPHVLLFESAGAMEDLVTFREYQFNAGRQVWPTADEERGIGMRDRKWLRGERTLWLVPGALVGANPVFALVPAFHVATPGRNRVALDGLIFEGLPRRGPVLEGAGLKIEVERLAIVADGQ